MPAKTGCDAATEILDGELFDFDTEVQPIIEVLVSRTLEQALVEVLHEEEIAEMKQQQQKILALREAELAELRRLEQEEQKRQTERDRRFLQDKIAADLDREMQERITAAKLLQGRLDEIVPEVLAAVDRIETEKDRAEFERQITPWLAKEVAHEIGQWIDANALLEGMMMTVWAFQRGFIHSPFLSLCSFQTLFERFYCTKRSSCRATLQPTLPNSHSTMRLIRTRRWKTNRRLPGRLTRKRAKIRNR